MTSQSPGLEGKTLVLDRVIQGTLVVFVIASMFSISVTQISFSIGALAWLIKAYITKSWKEISLSMVEILILIFCLACVLAVATSVDFETSVKSLKKTLQFIIFFWVAHNVSNEKQRDLLIKLLVVAGCVAAINGFSQTLETALTIASRVSGTMSTYMTFAGVLMLVGLFALGNFLFQKNKNYWILSGIAIICSCLLLTLTRQAWLGFFVGTLFLVYFWNKKFLLAIPLILAGFLLFSPESVKDRLYTMVDLKDWTLQARIFLWQGGWAIFQDHPITGCGFKCVDVINSQYPDPSGYIAKHRGMHNNVIQLMVDTGILGASLWISIWVAYFVEVFKRLKRLSEKDDIDGKQKGMLMGSLAALLGFLAGGMFETNFYDSEVTMLLLFILAISLIPSNKDDLFQTSTETPS